MVGAPTPAPVAATQGDFIPGYFTTDGCSALSKVESQAVVSVGARIKCGDDIGTVKYVGEVSGYSGLWYGVEWDEAARGRHSGVVNGRQYFCTSRPDAGSFVRPNKVAPSITCAEAIRKHYADKEDETTAAHRRTVIGEWKREINAPFIEMVGFEKVRLKQVRLDRLVEASVHDECVSSAGELAHLCPHLQVLDVSRNLFSSWREIITLSSQLPSLRDLDLSKNRLAVDMSAETLAQHSRHFASLEKLNLSHCEYEWADVARLARLWPRVRELVAACNRVTRVTAPAGALQALQVLRLDGNALAGWEAVAALGALPALRVLSLNDCGLESVRFGDDTGKVELFERLEVLFLNRNRIDDWRSVGELDKLKSLKKLYFLKNPVLSSEDYDTSSQLIIAKIGSLQELNGSTVSAELRRGAEYDYLKRYGGEWNASRGDAELAHRLALQHGRLRALVDKYGIPEDSLLEKQPKHTSLTSKLIEIHLKDDSGGAHTKKFPSNMMVQKLATMAQRLFRGRTGRPELFCLDEERGREIPLDSGMKDLNFFSVKDGDTVLVRWS